MGCKDEPKAEKTTKQVAPKPNVVIIYIDDLAYGDLSSYGVTKIETSNIDALAKGGVCFANEYSASAF